MSTAWADDVSPDAPLPEYPRPQHVRPDWLNLNGRWDYTITKRRAAAPERYAGEIVVPFPVESSLSGVARSLGPGQRLWYRRKLEIPKAWRDRRLLLHFGAVDWEAEVWLGGTQLGIHRGGYLPFSFEITDAVDWEQPSELRVAAWDPTQTGRQQRGKQSLRPKLVFYTAVSGIWQTVWVEPVPHSFIRRTKLTPDIARGLLDVEPEIDGPTDGLELVATASRGGEVVGETRGAAGAALEVPVPDAALWTPDEPALYDLELRLEKPGGAEPTDRVASYFAMRSFGIEAAQDGARRLTLNGEAIFQLGPLDQGYWPDGLYTAPTDDALRFDVEVCKRLGFNMIRKHIKVEPARWYHHCDQLGVIVWQDMPNGGALGAGFGASMLASLAGIPIRDNRMLWRFGRSKAAVRDAFRDELREMIEELASVPCIGVWVPFNEGWGQFESRSIAKLVRELDPTRLVDAASGWFDQGAGDLSSNHVYVGPALPPLDGKRAAAVTEFGGLGLAVEGHRWKPKKMFVYRKLETAGELEAEYVKRIERLKRLIEQGLAAAVYTQLTDVEVEVNGYLTYDRRVEKMNGERLAKLHREVIAWAASKVS